MTSTAHGQPSAGPAPDVETASDEYARRFGGRVGAFFLDVQARAVVDLLARWPRARVVDVGGGHGQLVGPLADAGHAVTVVGSDASCGRRVAAEVRAGRAAFQVGALTALPFPDRAFDVALAFRLLPHVDDWRALVGELARVAARAVVLDYPSRRSMNAAAGPLFGMKKGVEGDTRPFRVFDDDEVRRALEACGLRVTGERRQFALPMALHRAMGTAALSRAAEGVLRGIGLTARLGSPVVLRAERHA